MKIPVFEKFFGCVELRPACIGIGYGYGILMLISFVVYLLSLTRSDSNSGGAIAASIFSIISIALCVLLVVGVKRDRPSYVNAAMWFLVVNVVLMVLGSIANGLASGLIFFLIYLPFSIYCVLIVRSYYLVMTGSTSAPQTGP